MAALADKSTAAKDLSIVQEQLDEALQDAQIVASPTDDAAASEDLVLDETQPKPDHDAVKALVASRIASLVGKIKAGV